jgi:hypothetical protein
MRRRHDGRWPGSQGSQAQLHHFPMHDLRAIGEVYLRGVRVLQREEQVRLTEEKKVPQFEI